MIDATGISTFTFDAADRLETVLRPSGWQLNYARDELGQVFSVEESPSGAYTEYTRDENNQLFDITNFLPSGLEKGLEKVSGTVF